MVMSLRFRFALLWGNYVTEEQSMEVAEYSKVLNISNSFLEWDFRERCINIILYPERIENDEWYGADIYIYIYIYIYLKEKFV